MTSAGYGVVVFLGCYYLDSCFRGSCRMKYAIENQFHFDVGLIRSHDRVPDRLRYEGWGSILMFLL